MPSRLQNHYSTLYSQSAPAERRFNFWPYLLGIVILIGFIAVGWWLISGQGPSNPFRSDATPSGSNKVVSLDLAGQRFFIPENYLRSRQQRSGGEVDKITLHALWPSMRGFSESLAEDFRDKSARARVIYITLTAPTQVWRPAERFYQVYPYYFAGPEEPAEFSLKTRKMDPGSGIADHDVLYHQDENAFTLFHCLRDKPELMPADCVGDKVIEPRILARYRFRRTMLSEWQEIDAAIEELLAGFAGR